MAILAMHELALKNKVVMIREDFNVPLKDGRVANDKRIMATLPTIQYALDEGARIILVSHLGRPTEGVYDSEFSLEPVADLLRDRLQRQVVLVKDWQTDLDKNKNKLDDIILLENIRFCEGEDKNSPALAKQLASLCDVFVMDAFACSHRKQASTYGVMEYAKVVCAGPLLLAELDALEKALQTPTRPLVAIVGGAKVSTKLSVLLNLSKKVDKLIVGGGIANTFIAASGLSVGASLYESSQLTMARTLLEEMHARGTPILIPVDVVVAKDLAPTAKAVIKPINRVEDDDKILDMGPDTNKMLCKELAGAGTILWNGPIGVFEFDQFAEGTKAIAYAVAQSKAFSVAGGGDTLSAIDKFCIADNLSYISTGGGAFLEFVEGKKLPAIAILEQRSVVEA
ncbi:MAG: phosphoglycerate kinase [Gammaproteobacteria bacterium]|nr:phosphoglycerate kinase [Gammaproteobacteria bacterium]